LPGGNGKLCGIVALHRNLGNGNSWPVIADYECCIGDISVTGNGTLY